MLPIARAAASANLMDGPVTDFPSPMGRLYVEASANPGRWQSRMSRERASSMSRGRWNAIT